MTSRALVYARLVRLPNVFTAVADIGLGILAAGRAASPTSAVLLVVASTALYSGGMVWNDYFDVEQDRRERPFRPLPSGAVSRFAAARLGVLLLAGGWLSAVLAGWRHDGFDIVPAVVAGLLVVSILWYDGWLKRTPAWFARTEARHSDPMRLRQAAAVMAAGLVLALPLPLHLPEGTASVLFPYLLVIFAFIVGIPAARAWSKPEPGRVQFAVKRAVLGLIVLDAVLATAVAGSVGLVLLVLLPPAVLLGQWLYST
jgi:4-hydroxybenzoate polyprenyltransferase